ncbi:MAG: T9SS type A sorting domain-containing protein [Bacteroidota bacterium]|nr:T9SS type A sorting domain-containing protein [Bacteroidota bacterium]
MKTIILTIGIFLPVLVNAQAPAWQWAAKAGFGANDRGTSVAFSKSTGESVATGFYHSNGITFGTVSLSNTLSNLTSDIFLVKYSSAGSVLWAKTFGTTGNDHGTGVCTDIAGNIYLTGYFDAASITFGSVTLTTIGEKDWFVVKFDPSGNVVWAANGGGTEDDYPQAIDVDATGNVFITGYYKSGSIQFGANTLVNLNINSYDIFLAKYNSSGSELWARACGGTGEEESWSIAADVNGDVVVAGNFRSTVFTIDAITLNNPSPSGYEAIVYKYSSSGNFMWIRQYGSIYAESFLDVDTDASGNIVAAGYFEAATLTVGSVVLTNSTAFSFLDIFVVKLNAAGNVLWAKSAGGNDDEYAFCTGFDNSGNAYVSGYYESGLCTFSTNAITNYGGWDMFISKYDSSGNNVWAISGGASGNDRAFGMDINNADEVITTGYFGSSSITFGPSVITNSGNDDFFIAKLSSLTGIENSVDNELLEVFQSGNEIYIACNTVIDEIEIFNLSGQIIFKSTPATERVKLSLDDSGIYFLTARSKDKFLRKKILLN